MAVRGKKLRDIDYTIKDLNEETGISKKKLREKIISICDEKGIELYKIKSNESEKGDYTLLYEWYELLKLLIEFGKENPFGRSNSSKNRGIGDIKKYYDNVFTRIEGLPKYIKEEIKDNNYYRDNERFPETIEKLSLKLSELISAIFLIASDEQVDFMNYISRVIDGWIDNLYVNRTALNLAVKDYKNNSDLTMKVRGELKFYSIDDLLKEVLAILIDEYNYEAVSSKKEIYEHLFDGLKTIEDKRFLYREFLQEKYDEDESRDIVNQIAIDIKTKNVEKDFFSMKEEMKDNINHKIEGLKTVLETVESASTVEDLVESTKLEYKLDNGGIREFRNKVESNTYKYKEDVDKFITNIVINNYIK